MTQEEAEWAKDQDRALKLPVRSAAKPTQCHLNQKATDRFFAETASEVKEVNNWRF